VIAAWFRRLPIRHKLVAMIMATAGSVLLVASLGYIVTDYLRARSELVTDLRAQASLIMENSAAALLYKDPDAAAESLGTLAYNPHVRAACMYTRDGQLFAQFSTRTADPCPAQPGPERAEFLSGRLELVSAPAFKGDPAGSIYIRSDLALLERRRRTHILAVLLLLLLALGVGLVVSSRLQGVVSEPVMALARTAGEVSARGDYGIRANRASDDELGVLVDAFNGMLDQIQVREQELSKANDGLRREIVERRRAEQERAELLVREREANRLKDEFLATLSHELRTPLNAILGWTKLLRSEAVPPGDLDRALEKIERNAQVQTRLVEDLLEVSRITTGKLRLEMRPVDLAPLMATAIESIRPVAEARGVTIDRALASPALPTMGDPDRLQQVIWNLLSNAVKFTPSGGSVRVTAARQGGEDVVAVADTGIGIEPAFLPSVFDTFRQADASSTRAHGGLGLGLSIVKHLVEMHGGTVRADSGGSGKGATFTVRLPVRTPAGADAGSALARPSIVERRLAGATVVVVEDDTDTRELLTELLEASGATVRTAASAVEAVAACVELRPLVLVSDIAMPGIDGYEMMRQLKAVLGSEMPRISIAVTAFAGSRDVERSSEAGFQRHITKPFDPASLVRLLADLIEQDEELRTRR
jgi:signal transduction histidine kinase/ActR/RegA family two-component response regulator